MMLRRALMAKEVYVVKSRIQTLSVISALVMLCSIAGLAGSAPSKPHAAKAPSKSSRHAGARGRGSRKGAWKRHGQQKITPDRVKEIQEALIREKVLEGAPTGIWDSRTQAAMERYQAVHGWQSKVTPDSRALIKLGLGPSYTPDNSLNLEGRPVAPAVASSSAPAKDPAPIPGRQ